jgi:hypothetical protein
MSKEQIDSIAPAIKKEELELRSFYDSIPEDDIKCKKNIISSLLTLNTRMNAELSNDFYKDQELDEIIKKPELVEKLIKQSFDNIKTFVINDLEEQRSVGNVVMIQSLVEEAAKLNPKDDERIQAIAEEINKVYLSEQESTAKFAYLRGKSPVVGEVEWLRTDQEKEKIFKGDLTSYISHRTEILGGDKVAANLGIEKETMKQNLLTLTEKIKEISEVGHSNGLNGGTRIIEDHFAVGPLAGLIDPEPNYKALGISSDPAIANISSNANDVRILSRIVNTTSATGTNGHDVDTSTPVVPTSGGSKPPPSTIQIG